LPCSTPCNCSLDYGGSQIRPEATGFGTVIFAQAVLTDEGKTLKDKRCIVTGSGNVAQYCVMKLLEEGATVLAMSDSLGYVFKPEGFTMADLEQVMAIKSRHSGKLRDFKAAGAQYVEGHKPWELNVPVDMAFPCATQHELNLEDATNLIKNGCKYVFEGANMPSTDRAIACFHKARVLRFYHAVLNGALATIIQLGITCVQQWPLVCLLPSPGSRPSE
jgi:glutamate dehydrogenase (NADP+)